MKSAIVFFAILASVFADEKFLRKNIKINGKKINVEIAETVSQQQQGLMYRKFLPENSGMLFIFQDSRPRTFWMKNTFIPLSIGFFDEKKMLIDVQEMEPIESEMVANPKVYQSRGLARYALEMRKGWFSKNKIKLGMKLDFGE
jgi:uncharacterized protein